MNVTAFFVLMVVGALLTTKAMEGTRNQWGKIAVMAAGLIVTVFAACFPLLARTAAGEP